MSRRRNESGLTLMELVVATSLLMMVLGMAGDFVITSIQQQGQALTRQQLERQSRFALDTWVHEVRTADSQDVNVDPVASLTSTSFTFYASDRQTPEHMQKISYRLNGTNFEKSVTVSTNTANAPWTFPTTAAYYTAVPNVQSLSFVYKDANNAVTASTAKVQRVEMTVTIDNDPTHSPVTQTYALTASLRITNE